MMTALAVAALCLLQAPPPVETKRAAAGQEFGVLNYIIDRSVPQVVSVQLKDNFGKVMGTYTLDETNATERVERIFFGRRRGSIKVTLHIDTECYWLLKDEVEEAKGTWTCNAPAEMGWDSPEAAGRILERHKRDVDLMEAIVEDLCITFRDVRIAPPKGHSDEQPSACSVANGDADNGTREAPTPPAVSTRCAGTFSVTGIGFGKRKSVACRAALDHANQLCANDLCPACCEVHEDCDCPCLGNLATPVFRDFACTCFRSGDICVPEVLCDDGLGGFMYGDGTRHTVTIHYPTGTQGNDYFPGQLWFVTQDPQNPYLSLGFNIDVGHTTDLGVIPAGQKLVFAMSYQGFSGCPGPLLYTGPASNNPDGLIHARMDCPNKRVLFEQTCYGGDFDYNDGIFEVKRSQ